MPQAVEAGPTSGSMGPIRRIGIDYVSAASQRAGIGRYTRELVRALLAEIDRDPPERRPAVRLLVPRRPAVPLPTIPPLGRYRRLPFTEWQASVAWHHLRLPLPADLFTGPVDVFHEPDFVLPPVRAPRRVVTVHDLSYEVLPDLAHPAVYRYLTQAVPRSLARADRIIAVSESTKRDLQRLLGVPEERIAVIYEGVDPSFRPEPDASDAGIRARLALPDRYLLSVGTIQPRKNYTGLLEACERVWQASSSPV
ncbi:MAG TPA: glycosyltransferase family 1 protein [Dehalococcoidia bacterium]|nr:glycosyltransferase family 1 protein [Dehalococcoidia bacterium]